MATRIHVICHSNPGLSKEGTFGLEALNKDLAEGWTVVKTEPMVAGGAGAGTHPSFALAFVLHKNP